MRNFLAVLLVAFSGVAYAQDDAVDRHQASRDFFDHFAFLEGDWQLENFIMRGPNNTLTLEFTVTVERIFEGMGHQSHWVQNDTGAWIGDIINTYDVETNLYSVRFFDARANRWVESAQEITLTETGFESQFSGEDQHGPFDSRTRMERISDDHYRQTIERRYPGTDWFVTDRVEATRD
ncbi:hypothetical protein [Hyphobacterium indicum]|jgi:hypothetical protein|uniref:hypothetical protein n=1 Tax=Hyphobacterium indicum TaxID=2162714 RepID=UPI000D6437E6|nr:hypothetical protein [Hyphobacterium indicum]